MVTLTQRLMSMPVNTAKAQRPWIFVALWTVCLGAASLFSFHSSKQEVSLVPVMVEVAPVAPLLVAGQIPRDRPLPAAPDNRITEETPEGRLPIAAGGLMPRLVYAYPFNRNDNRPRIAIILTEAGPQAAALTNALRKLPGSVVVALSASTPQLDDALASVREAGHETLLTIPMEGTDPAQYDPGPNALRRNLSAQENLHRLRKLMGSGSGYVGLALEPAAGLIDNQLIGVDLLEESERRGLLWLAPSPSMYGFADLGRKIKVPVFSEEVVRLDEVLTPAALEAALMRLENLARLKGRAVAVSSPYPLVVNRLHEWLPALNDKGIALAPLSALAPTPSAPSKPAPPAAAPAHEEAPHATEAHAAPAPPHHE